ncbi:hypothetical protein [Pseudoxanthomonas mexicana]|uniref:hypothetical protein n=1 Tax=Pseudoxanthomonas mexicana TaxID=128785 RepID=UPI0024E21C93|nr:hypothetical protein [Pseudoxanthomonas mexicana]
MSVKQRGAFGIGAAIGIVGVGVAGALGFGLKKVSDTADARISALQALLDQRSSDLIRAIPGERYLQIIDALNGPDPEKRKQAQAFLTKLGALKLDTSMMASASFGFSEGSPLRAQILSSATNEPTSVRFAFRSGEIENLVAVRSTMSPAPTPEELRQNMIDAYSALLDKSWRPPQSIWNNECAKVNVMSNEGAECFERASTQLKYQGIVDASLRAYHQGREPKPLGDATLSISWDQLRHRYVIIALVENDLKAHAKDDCVSKGELQLEGKGCITVWVHPKEKPEELAYAGGLYQVSVNEFFENEPIVWKNRSDVHIRWVARRMDPAQLLDEDTIKALTSIRALEEQLKSAKAPKPGNT